MALQKISITGFDGMIFSIEHDTRVKVCPAFSAESHLDNRCRRG
jgi:hypothetical protein